MESKRPQSKRWQRILVKLSGEAFAGEKGVGLDPKAIDYLARELISAYRLGIQLAVVVGGGNIVRGSLFAQTGIEHATADYMGMLATVINALALQAAIESHGVDTRVQSAITMQAAGTGNPFFTTDTAASLRAVELNADALLKATNVDGVYDRDPHQYPDAVRFEHLSFEEALQRQLRIMDLTAFTLCMERQMEVVVFNIWQAGNLRRVVQGEPIGTLIRAS
jgi:uridylate kinase